MTQEHKVIHGDALDVMDGFEEESFHAVVTDPPYGLAFMGRSWDDFEPKEYQEWCEDWATKAKRVLKPGGHLLAFSGNRTHHRLFTGVEDAGFEIRDTLTWHYGSGFPKASDISKTIDKRADAEREDLGPNPNAVGRSYNKTGGDYNDDHKEKRSKQDRITAPATEQAKEWDGWKTGLKPATEFVVLARKPFDGATVDCVQEHGTGALNIDGTRIDTDPSGGHWPGGNDEIPDDDLYGDTRTGGERNEKGRYPANVIFDDIEAERLDREVGETSAGGGNSRDGDTTASTRYTDDGGTNFAAQPGERRGDSGGPSRYFYTSKAHKDERTMGGRVENEHPTVKPIDLIRWLIRLVSRGGQRVLDPFAGSGTHAVAALAEARESVSIEMDEEHVELARKRIDAAPEYFDDREIHEESDARTTQSALEW